MMANGPLEIYSMVIGAREYGQIFNIMAATGLAFLPILSLFFHNITFPYESEIINGTDTSLRKVGINFFIIVFTIIMFVAPTHQLDVTSISYQPVCSPDAAPSRFGDTGTTYDKVFANFEYRDIHIPVGMALILSGASGITNAAIVSLPCKTDVQKVHNVIRATHLPPDLKQEVERFNTECYAPAKARFNNLHPKKNDYKEIMEENGGESDLSWMGSHVYQKLYYSDIHPSSPVSSFPYKEFPYNYEDLDKQAGIDNPNGGFPNCLDWWSNSEYGLQRRLVEKVDSSIPEDPHLGSFTATGTMTHWLDEVKQYAPVGPAINAQDVISYDLIYDPGYNAGFGDSYTGWMKSGLYSNAEGMGGVLATAGNVISGVTAFAGQGMNAVLGGVERSEIDQEIPILQAVLMALCLSLGPIILVLGGYRINVIFSYYFILSSIISITFVENLIHYLEVSLHASQSYGIGALANMMIMYNIFTKLYLYAPIIYLMLMSICGVSLGSAVRDAMGAGSITGAGAGVAKKAISAAVKKIGQ